MKQVKKVNYSSKKYIIAGIVLIMLFILSVIYFAISASAETDTTEAIKDEQTLVRMSALIAKGADSNDEVNVDALLATLEKYTGSGKVSVTEKSSDTLLVTFLETGREYEVDVNIGVSGGNSGGATGGDTSIELPSTEYTTPYLPTGFSYKEGDLDSGLVIADGSGNEYVWIEVPRTATVYDDLTYDLDSITGTELANAYTAIETDLKEYTATYKSSSYSDTWYSEAQHGFASVDDYNALKQKMLKSVYKNGGFYIGRYETGKTSNLHNLEENTPVIQQNAYPYNRVTCSEAQSLASGMISGLYNTSLMFGVQWDLVLKYLETKGATQSELKSDSQNWGNYINSTYTLNRGKYVKYGSSEWNDYTIDLTGIVESRVKQSATSSSNSILYTTGASDQNRKQNIYDLAGNIYEWTLEYTAQTLYPCAGRGSFYTQYSSDEPANYRCFNSATGTSSLVGFRVSLF